MIVQWNASFSFCQSVGRLTFQHNSFYKPLRHLCCLLVWQACPRARFAFLYTSVLTARWFCQRRLIFCFCEVSACYYFLPFAFIVHARFYPVHVAIFPFFDFWIWISLSSCRYLSLKFCSVRAYRFYQYSPRSKDSIIVTVDFTLLCSRLVGVSQFRFNLFWRWPLVAFVSEVLASAIARSLRT